MFKKNVLYKHVNNTTIAFRVLADETSLNSTCTLFITWYNIGQCHKPYGMNIYETVNIKNEDLVNWEEYYKLEE